MQPDLFGDLAEGKTVFSRPGKCLPPLLLRSFRLTLKLLLSFPHGAASSASVRISGHGPQTIAARPQGGVDAPGTLDGMAHATKPAGPEVKRRREAAERMRGMFAHLAPGRKLSDELIADRRAEARDEDREAAEEARRLRGKR